MGRTGSFTFRQIRSVKTTAGPYAGQEYKVNDIFAEKRGFFLLNRGFWVKLIKIEYRIQ
jgi:hypothetical protein